jgi:uncharacterized Zn finger protein
MDREQSGRALQSPPKKLPHTCRHNRLISDRVSEEEHKAGKVRCVECGSIFPDPHLQRDDRGV